VLSPEDRTYLAQLVAARAGISQPEAEQRVDRLVKQMNDAQTKIREAADAARKRAAQLSIMLALSMVIGAFVASVAAAYGGSIRDEY
jgi:type VI protein secretion system component VasF